MLLPGHYFCAPESSLSTSDVVAKAGYCCDEERVATYQSTDQTLCSKTDLCSATVPATSETSTLTAAEQALFLTYGTGVEQKQSSTECPQITATSKTEGFIEVVNGGTLVADEDSYMACYTVFESLLKEDNYVEGNSEMILLLESASNAEVFLFSETDRKDAVSLIEQGDKLYPGNPLYITDVTKDYMIVFHTTVNGDTSSGSFTSSSGSMRITYQVSGLRHPFWYLPFENEHEAYWHMFRLALIIVPTVLIWLLLYTLWWRPCVRKVKCCCCCGYICDKKSAKDSQAEQSKKVLPDDPDQDSDLKKDNPFDEEQDAPNRPAEGASKYQDGEEASLHDITEGDN